MNDNQRWLKRFEERTNEHFVRSTHKIATRDLESKTNFKSYHKITHIAYS